MKLSLSEIELVINSTATVRKHSKEIESLRGDSFNLFTVLRIENYENETHSAFLGELLNPLGTHLFGATFLRFFLETIGYKGNLCAETSTLVLEKDIGSIDLDHKTGGRIDIYIYDTDGNSISIENKIYAADQPNQIERYKNYNKHKNCVYYLTLDGRLASTESLGTLNERENYYCISYRTTILSGWKNV